MVSEFECWVDLTKADITIRVGNYKRIACEYIEDHERVFHSVFYREREQILYLRANRF